jgi:hypothetical protein
MATHEQIHKEIDLIQDVIKRMASNSFEVKKWLIGILTAIVVFKHEELMGGNTQFIWLLLVPVLSFWYLDSFFLSTEKLYREIYKWVIQNRSATDMYLFDLNTMERKYPGSEEEDLVKKKNSILNVAISPTIWPFYIVPALFILVYGVIYNVNICCHCCCK